MLDLLSKVAPGTALRDAIDNIIRGHMGALIVVGGEPDIEQDCEGGIKIDVPFRPALLYELAKMDGAILLDRDLKRIRRANVELVPKISAPSTESGMRHRTAERIARTREALIIAISERRSTVSLYWGAERYVLRDIGYILNKATGALASMTRYDRLFRGALRRLSEAEGQGPVHLVDVVEVLRRTVIVLQIRQEINRYIMELGRDGRLIDLQMEEYPNVDREWHWLWRDYQRSDETEVPAPFLGWEAKPWSPEEWCRLLGYSNVDERVVARGYRFLHNIPRLPEAVIDRLVAQFNNMVRLREATVEELDRVEGVGRQRAYAVWRALRGEVEPDTD